MKPCCTCWQSYLMTGSNSSRKFPHFLVYFLLNTMLNPLVHFYPTGLFDVNHMYLHTYGNLSNALSFSRTICWMYEIRISCKIVYIFGDIFFLIWRHLTWHYIILRTKEGKFTIKIFPNNSKIKYMYINISILW